MRAVGIAMPHIYGAAAYQCGGYDRLPYSNSLIVCLDGAIQKGNSFFQGI